MAEIVLGMGGPYSQDQINEYVRVSNVATAEEANSRLVHNYEAAVDQYKKNRDSGHPGPIPLPEYGFRVYRGADGWWTISQDGPPVAPAYVEEGAPVVPLVVAVGPAIYGQPGRFLRGYVNGVPDNTPAGYLAQPWGPGGPAFRKVIDPSPFGYTAYYQLVQ